MPVTSATLNPVNNNNNNNSEDEEAVHKPLESDDHGNPNNNKDLKQKITSPVWSPSLWRKSVLASIVIWCNICHKILSPFFRQSCAAS